MAEHESGANGNAPDDYPLDDPALTAQYRRAALEQPPTHLDKTILKAARESLRAKKTLAFSPFASDWHVPAALAAVLVLSVVMVLNMHREPMLPSMKEPLPTQPAPARVESGKTAGGASVTEHARTVIETRPQSVTPATGTAPVVPGGNKMTAAKSSPGAASRVQPTKHEQAPVPAFERLFIPGTSPEPPSRIQADIEAAVPRGMVPVPRTAEQEARTPLNPLKKTPAAPRLSRAEIEAKTTVKETSGTVGTAPGDAERRLQVQQFIATLTGTWSGRAVTTPVGPMAYDINFRSVEGDCITGTAHPGSNHTWTFCARDGVLRLDFLTDFRGNRTPIRFRQLGYEDGVYTFKADTHDFMEVLVHAAATSAWMKIFHYGKLHVEILLKRK